MSCYKCKRFNDIKKCESCKKLICSNHTCYFECCDSTNAGCEFCCDDCEEEFGDRCDICDEFECEGCQSTGRGVLGRHRICTLCNSLACGVCYKDCWDCSFCICEKCIKKRKKNSYHTICKGKLSYPQ